MCYVSDTLHCTNNNYTIHNKYRLKIRHNKSENTIDDDKYTKRLTGRPGLVVTRVSCNRGFAEKTANAN